jgi:uncharacterized membrane protein
MGMLLAGHIAAGAVALVSGYIALFVVKGGARHRQSGRVFVYAMLPMAALGFLVAAVDNVAPAINIPAATLTFYMVVTSLTTVRPPARGAAWLNRAGMVMAFAIAIGCFVLGVTIGSSGGARAAMAFPLFIFGNVALIAGVGDRRMIRAGGLTRTARLRRHLWRMCYALFVAAGAFFLGQADEFPAALRIRPLLALPVLSVLATMAYWLWRTRERRALRVAIGRAAEAVQS